MSRLKMWKLVDKLKSWIYAIPFGMKGADDAIFGSASDGHVIGADVVREVDEQRVSKHLLKGEVTQEVADLRWRLYKVASEASKYEYVGHGMSIRRYEGLDSTEKTHIRFKQGNMVDVGSVHEGIGYADSNNRFLFDVTYTSCSRFMVNKFITQVDVDIDKDSDSLETLLHFSVHANPDIATSKMFVNELARCYESLGGDGVYRGELFTNLDSLGFSTYKAVGEDDFVTYSFLGGHFVGMAMTKDENEYVVRIRWDAFMRLPIDLAEKYYSGNLASKYENKELRDTPIEYNPQERKVYCEVCGKEMSVYDADILDYDGGMHVCTSCLMKLKDKEEKND